MNTTANFAKLPAQQMLVERVRARHAEYELPKHVTDLHLTRTLRRRNSTLYQFSDARAGQRPCLVVKIPLGHSDHRLAARRTARNFEDRPRLFARANPADKPLFEFRALRRLQEHFQSLGDPRFGVLKIHDFFPDVQALVMDWNPNPGLRTKILQQHRFTSAARTDVLDALVSSGHWLREYHRLDDLPHTVSRTEGREDVIAAMDRCIRYLAEHLTLPRATVQTGEELCRLAEVRLPAALPTGMVHGDYAPRNILVADDMRITVFDTLGRFRAPIYEDVAKMLVAVKSSGPRMYSRNLVYSDQFIGQCEQAFLSGYFCDRVVPWNRVRLFEAQQLLEIWSAIVHRHVQANGFRRITKSFRRFAWARTILGRLRRIVDDLQAV